jgi:hypothetical protein
MTDENSDNHVKKIIIEFNHETKKNKNKNKNIKSIHFEKEKKMRVETKTWGLNLDELSHEKQLTTLKLLDGDSLKNKYCNKLTSHLKSKICSYKQQDILKKKLIEDEFVSLQEVIHLLKLCEMKCCYCSQEVYILYEHVREMKQWSLDRINNDIGHNKGNLVIACLECNLKRRRTNKDAFMFTKNMVIIKEGN